MVNLRFIGKPGRHQDRTFLIFCISKYMGKMKKGIPSSRNRSFGSFFAFVTKNWTITALRYVCYKQLHFLEIKGLGEIPGDDVELVNGCPVIGGSSGQYQEPVPERTTYPEILLRRLAAYLAGCRKMGETISELDDNKKERERERGKGRGIESDVCDQSQDFPLFLSYTKWISSLLLLLLRRDMVYHGYVLASSTHDKTDD
ncbi:hypothetical protein M0802_003120 [Mischocyttarus mexicanus]|nr:hypothetical protein M0802_003120 [Mischocyttarus mexicanus]